MKPRELLVRNFVRPFRLLIFSPIIASLSVYQGLMYGFLYLLFATFPTVFQGQYGFSTGTVGLTYIGMGVGSLVGLVWGGLWSDAIYRKKSQEGTGVWEPENRLLPLVPGCVFIPIGLFWYGWSAQAKVHWIVPIIGTSFMGVGVNMALVWYPASLRENFADKPPDVHYYVHSRFVSSVRSICIGNLDGGAVSHRSARASFWSLRVSGSTSGLGQ